MRKLRLRLNHLPKITLLVSGQARILIQVLRSQSHARSMILGPSIVPQAPLFLGGFPLPWGGSSLPACSPPLCHPPTCLLPDPLQSSTSSALTVPRDLPRSGCCGTTCATMVSSWPHHPPGLPSRLPRALRPQPPLCPSVNHYKCPLCDMTCPLPSSLRNHMRFRHSEARPFKCDCCDYR